MNVAERLQSRVLFKEALIHTAGRYNELLHTPIDGVDKGVLGMLETRTQDLVRNKHDELKSIVQDVQAKIMSYYPSHLHRQSTTGRADRDPIGRADYGNDIWSWMALCLYRHWLGQNIIMVRNKIITCLT